jgi:hypothetical protein
LQQFYRQHGQLVCDDLALGHSGCNCIHRCLLQRAPYCCMLGARSAATSDGMCWRERCNAAAILLALGLWPRSEARKRCPHGCEPHDRCKARLTAQNPSRNSSVAL